MYTDPKVTCHTLPRREKKHSVHMMLTVWSTIEKFQPLSAYYCPQGQGSYMSRQYVYNSSPRVIVAHILSVQWYMSLHVVMYDAW